MSFPARVRHLLETVANLRAHVPAGAGQITAICTLAVLAGTAGVAFHELAAWIEHHTIARLAGQPWPVFLVGSLASVLAGSALASWLIARVAPAAAGGGVLPVKLAFWRDFGVIPMRLTVVKFFASAITLGSGVSLGPEGPAVQIGASTVSAAAGLGGVAKQNRRAYCAAGAAAGLAAVFNAPLAAITFVLEEIVGDLHSRWLGSVVLAAVAGALVAHALLGAQPAFQAAPFADIGWTAWALTPLVAAAAGFAGAAFQRGALWFRARGNGRRSRWRPLWGALATWVCGASVYLLCQHTGIFGIGYRDITAAIGGSLPALTAALLLVGKLVATCIAVGSGGCGGIFAPSLFLGAMSGALCAGLAGFLTPLNPSEQAMLVMTGMSASLGAVIRTPLTCVLLLFEVTNQFVIVPALMLAALVSQGVARLVNKHDMYEEMLVQDGVDPHQVLPPRHYKRWREIPVGALASFKPVVARDTDPATLEALLASSRHERFPVLRDSAGGVAGVLQRRDAEHAVATQTEPRLEPAVWIDARATIGAAQKRMLGAGVDFLCVGDESRQVLEGVLTLHDLLRGQSVLEEDA
ncbi:MAG TPA: chloride channel protein [Opitutaceae bacterium]